MAFGQYDRMRAPDPSGPMERVPTRPVHDLPPSMTDFKPAAQSKTVQVSFTALLLAL